MAVSLFTRQSATQVEFLSATESLDIKRGAQKPHISSKQLKSELNLPIKETQIRMRIKEAELSWQQSIEKATTYQQT
ncbi:hypothetical protein K0M31_001920 [Melipona bicolor]|uniref:Uncharacterized protein n=1 Tax=Melipona bicolor TaxID=60889 RepID=A0AA40GGL0_9HYME|nr:hypothetical protein K0M31_001920 [Melipona bicolor]